MKFQVTMKDSDTLHEAIRSAVKEDLCQQADLATDEREVLRGMREKKIAEVCDKWFEYSEYVTIEIDTEAKTAVVVEKAA